MLRSLVKHRSTMPTAGLSMVALSIVSLLFTVVIVQASIRHGKLGMPATYDDVSYLQDALTRVDAFHESGIKAFAASFVTSPPHSPASTAIATAAFLIAGAQDWAPYVANCVIVFFYLSITAWMMSEVATPYKMLGLVFAITVPITTNAVNEFKPDIFCGLITSAAAIVMSRSVFRPRSPAWPGVLLFAAALLIKPTFVGATLLFNGTAVLLALIGRRIVEGRRLDSLAAVQRAVLLLVGGAALALPYYVLAWRVLYEYIVENTFGANKHLWAIKTDWLGHAMYFLIGPGGGFMFGRHLYVIVLIVGCGITVTLFFRRRVELLCHLHFAVMCCVMYALPTSLEVKNPFSGVQFTYMLVFWAFFCYVRILHHAGRRKNLLVRITRFAVVAGLAVSTVGLRLPLGAEGAEALLRRQLFDRDCAIVREKAMSRWASGNPGPLVVVLTTAGQSHNPSAMQYALLKQGIRNVEFPDLHREGSPEVFANAFRRADIVIANEPNAEEAYDWLPSGEIQEQTLRMVRESQEFHLLAVNETIARRKYYVFERVSGFADSIVLSGFGEREGPYPQWSLPSVRWGLGPKSMLVVRVPGPGRARLIVSGLSYRGSQSIGFIVGQKEIYRHTFEQPGQFDTFVVPIQLEGTETTVEFVYGLAEVPNAADRRPRAVLFKTLQVTRDPST